MSEGFPIKTPGFFSIGLLAFLMSAPGFAMNNLIDSTPLLDLKDGFDLNIKSEQSLGNLSGNAGQTGGEVYLVSGKAMTQAEYGEAVDNSKHAELKDPVCILQTYSRDFPKSITPRILHISQVARSKVGVIMSFKGDASFKQLECLGSAPTLADVWGALGVAASANRFAMDLNHLNDAQKTGKDANKMIFTGKIKNVSQDSENISDAETLEKPETSAQ
jgi:hypothetical protein